MRRITIQYLIPVQVKSGQVKSSRGAINPSGDLEPGRDSSIAVTVTPFFSQLESGSPATLFSLCLNFFCSFFSCIGRRCKVVSTDSMSEYMYRTWLIHIHICIYIIFTLHMMHLSAGPVSVPFPISPVLSFSLSASFSPSLLTSFLFLFFFPSIPEKFHFNPD